MLFAFVASFPKETHINIVINILPEFFLHTHRLLQMLYLFSKLILHIVMQNEFSFSTLEKPGMLGLNQGKLNVVKQEMARVSINILEISELK